MGTSRLRFALTVGFVAATVSVGAVLGDGAAAGAGAVARTPPTRWDPRVAELADFVEHRRGLDFKHPVPVRFVSDPRFKKEIKASEGNATVRDRRDFERFAETLRALGLIRGSAADFLEQSSQLSASSVLAFYDPKGKEVVVRGTNLDVPTKVTVVHELTHAAQDQTFDLNKLFARPGRDGKIAVSSLIEGDALRTELEYVRTLNHADQTAYVEEANRQAEELQSGHAPAVLEIIGSSPYVLGPAFVGAIASERGEKGIDTVFRKPPKSDKQVLTPSTYLDRDNPKRVDPPKPDAGEKPIGKPESFGAVSLFATLIWRLPAEVALDAATGWGGDSLVRFERQGQPCVRVALTGDTPSHTDQIAAALEQWAAQGLDTAYTTHVSETVTLTSCNPHAGFVDEQKFEDGQIKLRVGAGVLRTRATFLLREVVDGESLKKAECVADVMARDTFVRAFFEGGNPPDEQQSVEISDKVAAADAACGAR